MLSVSPLSGEHTVFLTDVHENAPRAEIAATQDGRLTIPVQVRRAAGIEPGATLVLYVEDGRVIIETRERPDQVCRSAFATTSRAASWISRRCAAPRKLSA